MVPTRLGWLMASLLALACSPASRDAEPEHPREPDSAVIDDAGSMFDIGNLDASTDSACASVSASAVKRPVDLIFVIDQSGSMADEIAQVNTNINKLSDYLAASGLDYHVVMIAHVGTKNSNELCVPEPLGGPSSLCEDVTAPLKNSNPPRFRTSDVYVGSSNGLDQLLAYYSSSLAGVRWKETIRADAFKAIIPITDDNSDLTAAQFDKKLLALDPVAFGTATARNYAVYPIMGASTFPSEAKCSSTVENNGPNYIELAKLTSGKWFPLCSTSFEPLFTDIAKSVGTRVACELTIPPAPPGETLDTNKVNVEYTPSGGGTRETIKRDDSAPCNSGANGWQYNADKTKVLLCGDACKKVQADLGVHVDVAFGCDTVFR